MNLKQWYLFLSEISSLYWLIDGVYEEEQMQKAFALAHAFISGLRYRCISLL